MGTYVALLRGINVGGRNKVRMAELRSLCEGLGHHHVRTYVQSGNVVFASDQRDPEAIATGLREGMRTGLGVDPTVTVRDANELAAIVAANPFAEAAEADPTKVHVAFLAAEPAEPAELEFDPDVYAPEAIAVGERVRYLHLPRGMGRSRLAEELSRRRVGTRITVRNWRTVTALLAMSEVDR